MTYAYTSPWGPINRRFFFEDPGKVATLGAVNHALSKESDESPIVISKQELWTHVQLMHRGYPDFDEEIYHSLITGQDDFIKHAYTSVGWIVSEDKGHFYFTEPPPKQLGTRYPDTELPGRELRDISMDRGKAQSHITPIDRDVGFWMERIEREPDVPISAGVPDELPEPSVPRCQSSRDGEECFWDKCPQKANYQSYCPYAKAWEAYWEQFE